MESNQFTRHTKPSHHPAMFAEQIFREYDEIRTRATSDHNRVLLPLSYILHVVPPIGFEPITSRSQIRSNSFCQHFKKAKIKREILALYQLSYRGLKKRGKVQKGISKAIFGAFDRSRTYVNRCKPLCQHSLFFLFQK